MSLISSAAVMTLGTSFLGSGFIENAGQFPGEVRFTTREEQQTWVSDDGFVSQVVDRSAGRGVAVRYTFEGSDPGTATGVAPFPGIENYYIGDDPSRWASGVRRFARVEQEGIVPGVDLVLRLDRGRVEYDLRFDHAHAASDLIVRVDGAEGLRLDLDGTLLVETEIGTLRQSPPITFACAADGSRREVSSSFVILDRQRFGFSVDARPDEPITIDPTIFYVTQLGGSTFDELRDVDAGPGDQVATCGETESLDFPVTPGAFTPSAGVDAFVTVLNESGTEALFSTYLGGVGSDRASGVRIATDDTGATQVVVVGATESSDFPTTAGSAQSNLAGFSDHFVARFTSGGALVSSTYLGGSGHEILFGLPRLAIDGTGRAIVAGTTDSIDFPVTGGAFDQLVQDSDGYVARIKKDGGLSSATFLGGDGPDRIDAVDVDLNGGDVFVVGFTESSDFPSFQNAATPSFPGPFAAFAARIQPNGSALVRTTFLAQGGPRVTPRDVKVAANGDILVAGSVLPCSIGTFDCTSKAVLERYSKSLKTVVTLNAGGAGALWRVSERSNGELITGGSNANAHINGSVRLHSADGAQVQSISSQAVVGASSYHVLTAVGPDDSVFMAGSATSPADNVTFLAFDPQFESSTPGSTEPFVAHFDFAGDSGFDAQGDPCSSGASLFGIEGVGSTTPGFPLELRLVGDAPFPTTRFLLVGVTDVGVGSVGSCPLGLTPLLFADVSGPTEEAVIGLVLPPTLAPATLYTQVVWGLTGQVGATDVVKIDIP